MSASSWPVVYISAPTEATDPHLDGFSMSTTGTAGTQVGDIGGGEVVIVAGSSKGHLSRLRLTSPLAPGSDPSEVQVAPSVAQIAQMAEDSALF